MWVFWVLWAYASGLSPDWRWYHAFSETECATIRRIYVEEQRVALALRAQLGQYPPGMSPLVVTDCEELPAAPLP